MEQKDNKDYLYDEIDLVNLFQTVWKKKLLIITITSIFAILSVLYSLSLPNVYSSQALLAPNEEDSSISSQLGGLSGIAGIAGFGLQGNNSSKTQEAIERIQSFDFFSKHFLPNIRMENLMAVDDWIPDENTIIYNQNKYDIANDKWVSSATDSDIAIPSNQKAFLKYKRIINISENDDSGFISISVKHRSPYIAKKWVEIIVNKINESMRELDKKNAQNSINFLNESTNSATVQSIKDVITSLLESQMQKLMLASAEEAYVFKIIDSAIVPEEKSEPNRALICIFGTFLGGVLSLLIIFIQSYRENFKI